MPLGDDNAKMSWKEWYEYHARRAWHHERFPKYADGWGRPKPETAEEVWGLLKAALAIQLEDLFPPFPPAEELPPDERHELEDTAKQALLVVVDRVVRGARRRRTVTLNNVFDALAARWSDHFRRAREESGVFQVRDMKIETAKACRRDLLRAGISFDKLWDEAVGKWLKKHDGNPLYSVKETSYGPHKVTVKEDSQELAQFECLVRSDRRYDPQDRDRRLLLRGDPLPGEELSYPSQGGGLRRFSLDPPPRPRERRQRICAERPYNVVHLGPRSVALLDAQERAQVFFDAVVFREDYDKAEQKADRIKQELWERYKVDATALNWKYKPRKQAAKKPSPGEGAAEKKRKKRFRSPREWQLWRVPEGERETAKALVKEYDKAWGLTANFCTVSETLREGDEDRAKVGNETLAQVRQRLGPGESTDLIIEAASPYPVPLRIRSGFTRVINRRYQATHFWPTFVSSKPPSWEEDEKEDGEEDLDTEQAIRDERALRQRWFKLGAGGYELVGVDVSSSQTQILAASLGIEPLERVSSVPEKPFKEYLAEQAWQMHRDTLKDGYAGADDPRLIELVKNLWMRVLYGSRVEDVVRDQGEDPAVYGPGWTAKDANDFLEPLPGYKGVTRFLDACRWLAEVACDKDRYQGVILTDPFDGAKVRWNPVNRKDYFGVSSGGQRLILSLPRERVKTKSGKTVLRWARPSPKGEYKGDYAVDLYKLQRMVAPCLVHMLDAYFSSLVLERLTASHRDVIGLHDGWSIVPLPADDPNKNVRFAREWLIDVIREASEKWFEGLGTVYDRLVEYLGKDPEFGQDVRDWKAQWEARVRKPKEDWPHFVAVPSTHKGTL